MSTDNAVKQRTKLPRKAYTKSRTVSLKKAKSDKSIVSPARIMRNTRYRSMFEINIAKALAKNNVTFEYESKKLTYIPKPRNYTPDFYIPHKELYIETKGHLDKGDRVKMLLVKQQHPDLDIRFVFLNAKNKIYRGSKTTYAAWATKHGFVWAEKAIPEEWLRDE
tara:strand:- start:123 stop:617 length:495 start_codon:yes stop_codon:yes gene_type:complete